MNVLETVIYKNYIIEIHQDTDPLNPRDNDNLGTMICFHKRYDLGDKNNLSFDDFNSWEELESYIQKKYDPVVLSPIYMYDHSGIGISTDNSRYPFNCPWDAGQIGFIYISKKKAFEEYDWKKLTKKKISKLEKLLQYEIEDYNKYLSGDILGYIIKNQKGNSVDNLFGISDLTIDEIIQEAKETVDSLSGISDLTATEIFQTAKEVKREKIEYKEKEIKKLSNFLLKNYSSEIGKIDSDQGESAVDLAIRLLTNKKE